MVRLMRVLVVVEGGIYEGHTGRYMTYMYSSRTVELPYFIPSPPLPAAIAHQTTGGAGIG
jgi:hypothetical protein